ncbi:hypothetical protein ABK040_013509 [Willaertia magna]
MLGQFAFVEKNKTIPIPDNLDDISAAALPNAVMGSALALMDRGNLKKGQIVLINGATGVTGKVAVQLAKLYGASKVIVTGRNKEQLDLLLELGADKIISLLGTDEEIINELEQVYKETPIDLIIDYLWGHPIELIIQSLKSLVNHNTIINPIRIVTVGSMAGDTTNIPSLVLRSLPLEIVGSGFGSFSREGFRDLFVKYLPEAFEYAAQGKLKIDTEVHNLEDIENVWNKKHGEGIGSYSFTQSLVNEHIFNVVWFNTVICGFHPTFSTRPTELGDDQQTVSFSNKIPCKLDKKVKDVEVDFGEKLNRDGFRLLKQREVLKSDFYSISLEDVPDNTYIKTTTGYTFPSHYSNVPKEVFFDNSK